MLIGSDAGNRVAAPMLMVTTFAGALCLCGIASDSTPKRIVSATRMAPLALVPGSRTAISSPP